MKHITIKGQKSNFLRRKIGGKMAESHESEPLINLSEAAFVALGCPSCGSHVGTRQVVNGTTRWKCENCGELIGVITGSWAERVKESFSDPEFSSSLELEDEEKKKNIPPPEPSLWSRIRRRFNPPG